MTRGRARARGAGAMSTTTTTRTTRTTNETRGGRTVTRGKSSSAKDGKTEGGSTKRSEDFGRWFLDCMRECKLADYGPARGTMVIRPYGYAIWEGIQRHMDGKFKETGV